MMLPTLLRALIVLTLSVSLESIAAGAAPASNRLRVFFIDVEGGQSTLFVSPSGESLLVDTGWPGAKGRDADRIVSTARQAGLSRIDYVLITHFHTDHVGGVPQLVDRFPIGTFLDHGENRELDHGIVENDYKNYLAAVTKSKAKRIVLRPGDPLPLTDIKGTVISADGSVIGKALPGGGQPNPYCKTSEVRAEDQTENGRSLGIEITFGKLRILDLGDLTWDRERTLMCPANKLGRVDISIVSHHGFDQSSSPALVHAIHPRVAIMDNGEKKGGSPLTFKTLATSPGLEALWQLHYSKEAGGLNRDAKYIANPEGTDAGNGIELTALKDGSFDVLNRGNGEATHYPAAR